MASSKIFEGEMRANRDEDKKHVFICGLHRSGTSVLARNITKFTDCTGFRDTGVIEDEGQYLQQVYPPDVKFGGTGRYGFDPRAHLTEASSLLTPENAARLRADWKARWDADKAIRVEKTPANLIMTRFLQAVFPNAYFVVMRRHPVAVSMATQRWVVNLRPLHVLLEHWLRCYGLFEEDKKHLNNLYEIKYEDYITNVEKHHRELAGFLGTRPSGETLEQVTDTFNRKYFERWRQLLSESPFRGYYRYIAEKYEPRFVVFGYSLMNVSEKAERIFPKRAKASALAGRLYIRGADLYAFGSRLVTRTMGITRRTLRRWLPAPVKNRLKSHFGRQEQERVKRSLV